MSDEIKGHVEQFLQEHPGRDHHYHVEPRYSGGSPAQLEKNIALALADIERDCYEFDLEGGCGLTAKRIAQRDGLNGIVELRVEKQGGGWHVLDMITGERRDA